MPKDVLCEGGKADLASASFFSRLVKALLNQLLLRELLVLSSIMRSLRNRGMDMFPLCAMSGYLWFIVPPITREASAHTKLSDQFAQVGFRGHDILASVFFSGSTGYLQKKKKKKNIYEIKPLRCVSIPQFTSAHTIGIFSADEVHPVQFPACNTQMGFLGSSIPETFEISSPC